MDFDVKSQVIDPFAKQFGVVVTEVEFNDSAVDYVFERDGILLDAYVRFDRVAALYYPVNKQDIGRGVQNFRIAAYTALKMASTDSYASERKESAASAAKKRGTNVKRRNRNL